VKLIWHIIRKDLARYRWALLLWALLFVAQVGLGFVMLHTDNPDLTRGMWMQRESWLLVFLQFVAGYLLVTQFVQADELTGTQMFWLTRPVSAGRLLMAKALGILLIFGVLPVLLLLPWWINCGFSVREIGWNAAETLSWQLLMIAPAVAVAALTEEIGRALMWSLLLVTGLAAGTSWIRATLHVALVGAGSHDNAGLLFTRLWLAAAILVTGSLVVSAHQFLTRRFARSVTLAIAVLSLIAVVGRFWSVDCSPLFAEIYQAESPPLVGPESFAGVRMALGRSRIRSIGIGRDRQPRPALEESMDVAGLPEEYLINGRAIQSWDWADGSIASQTVQFNGGSDQALRATLGVAEAPDDPETTQWLRERRERNNALRVARGQQSLSYWPRLADSGAMVGYTRLLDPLVERIRTRPPASDLLVRAEVSRINILLELPLLADRAATGDSQSLRITSVFRPHRFRSTATLQLVLTSPALRSRGFWGLTALGSTRQDRLPPFVRAVDRTAGDSWGVTLRYGEGGEPNEAQVAGVKIQWALCGISSPRVVRDDEWVARYPDWYEHTSLVLLATTPVARFSREVKTNIFELDSSELDDGNSDSMQDN
jgi:hypothetical protein